MLRNLIISLFNTIALHFSVAILSKLQMPVDASIPFTLPEPFCGLPYWGNLTKKRSKMHILPPVLRTIPGPRLHQGNIGM